MNKIAKSIIKYMIIIVLSACMSILIRQYAFDGTRVVGDSMVPTLHDSDVIVLSKVPVHMRDLERGDIVSIDAGYKRLIKRIVGLPGDVVDISDGKVYVNGKAIREDYLEEGTITKSYFVDHFEIPKDHVFVLGDNREISFDSRAFGLVHYDKIMGVGSFIYAPIYRARLL